MPNDERSVTELVSGTSKDQDSSQSEGQKDIKELEKGIRANLHKEMERKLKESIDEKTQELEAGFSQKVQKAIFELENKKRLSNSQEDALKKLYEMKNHEDYSAWQMLIREQAKEELAELSKRIAKEDYDDAMEIVTDYAYEKGIDEAKFKEDIKNLLPRVKGFSEANRPTKLVRKAIKEWEVEQERNRKLKEYDELTKNKSQNFQETGSNRIQRTSTAGEDIKQAKETGAWGGVLSKLLDKQTVTSNK